MARYVLITGATSGIGKAIAYAFAENQDHLIITGRRREKLQAIQHTLTEMYGVEVFYYQMDVTQAGEVVAVCQKILEDVPQIDILINNAGLALGLEKFHEYDVNDMVTMIDTNVKGCLYMTRQILPTMVEKDQGHVITIGSTAGIYAYAGAAVYAATKSAVKVLNDGIRIDTIDKNIKVTTIQPGIVETDFSQVRFHGDKERAAMVYQGIQALQAEDIAQNVLFVANQPRHVQITDMTIMATKQATGFTIYREGEES
ncbi:MULTISPECIES: SDR family NAD(P)-dependent oxidoreductase [unclassified Streptococcus]|uniref:SDR family NAD(P)-dependent oxidoreductase n=1 Tax=unclassified Streptococcus TaxID=2608887 RepID=UPI0010728031|nr:MULTISPECIES: SDR family NAD(P)-dependent oxidoreductase [unclassified Streptococcus]MBF0788271.1 SDR family NAD(P)-dependent oxidoreductase [Streptococcus sp. 19428wC2_LYSM12]MCQ9212569.1 SDR family NAD(P)-dependent oxidoreductase [Streptococcus sp. B01]MCQ9213908.1 SDR family NAD(P)-dependent oxidoreductase [Streptococcus sp. O1]TFV04641.1 SDR family NAD(P)-dependent oxidoreductase [Streptococcus sp. LYSM12]